MAGLNGFCAVVAGAFGAHALKSRLDAEHTSIFETAVRYQMYHTVALLATAWFKTRRCTMSVTCMGLAFAIGTLIFSGSLYILALSGVPIWGAVTPFGGAGLLIGWLLMVREGCLPPQSGAPRDASA